MSGGGLFNRQYQVAIGTLARPNIALYGNLGTSGSTGGTPGAPQASALRVDFDIVKNSKDSPNKGTINITNMAPQTRRALRPGMQVKLIAGYSGQVQTLFEAGLFLIKTQRNGADITTSLELLDGDAAIFNTNFDKSYGAGSTVYQIFMDMVTTLQAPTPSCPSGINIGLLSGIPQTPISKNFVAHGGIRNTMADLCRNYGLEWSIQDGTLQIVPLASHAGDTGEVISKATGMLGVPSFDGTVLTVTCLLNPRLKPGRLIKVQSQDITGTFKIRGGHWQGDSHGDHWQVELECIPMAAAAAALNSALGQNLKELAAATKKATAKKKKGG